MRKHISVRQFVQSLPISTLNLLHKSLFLLYKLGQCYNTHSKSLPNDKCNLGQLRAHSGHSQRALRDHSAISQRSFRDRSEITHWRSEPTSPDDDVHSPFFLFNFYLISVLVKEVEDSGQIVLHLARAEQIEENQHVCHCWGEERVVSLFVLEIQNIKFKNICCWETLIWQIWQPENHFKTWGSSKCTTTRSCLLKGSRTMVLNTFQILFLVKSFPAANHEKFSSIKKCHT